MKVQFNEYMESKSVTAASIDNKAKRSDRNHFLRQEFEEIMNRLRSNQANKGSEQKVNSKVNRSQSSHAHFETKNWSPK